MCTCVDVFCVIDEMLCEYLMIVCITWFVKCYNVVCLVIST